MKLRIIGYFLLFVLLVPVGVFGQVAYMEEKAKVNKIKRSSQYLYGEGIAATVEEAMSMAEQSLKNAILAEIAENKELKNADQVLVNSIKRHSEKIQLKRGAMERVFLYVEKKNLYDSGKMVSLDIPEPAQTTPDTDLTPAGESGKQQEELVDDLYRTVPEKKSRDTSSGVEHLNGGRVFTPVSKPRAETLPSVPEGGVLETILTLNNVDQLQAYMQGQKELHKLMWGNVRSTLNDNWFLIILDGDRVVAVLDKKKAEGRKNLLTGEWEDVDRYSVYPKVWFIVYE